MNFSKACKVDVLRSLFCLFLSDRCRQFLLYSLLKVNPLFEKSCYLRNFMNFSKARSVDVLRDSKSISISPSSLSLIPDSLAKTISTSVPSSSVEYKIFHMACYDTFH